MGIILFTHGGRCQCSLLLNIINNVNLQPNTSAGLTPVLYYLELVTCSLRAGLGPVFKPRGQGGHIR